jgi:hypothetical protein
VAPDIHLDHKYCYSYTHHLELSKSEKAPLPPINNKLTSTSQNDHVNMEYFMSHDDNSPPFGSFVVETRSQASKPNPQGVEGAKTNPKENGKNKSIIIGRSPSPPRNQVPWTPNKVVPNDPPPCFPTLGSYNVVEDIAKFPTHMTLLDALRTLVQFENLSRVLQTLSTSQIAMRVPISKEAFSQPKEAYDAIDLNPRIPPFYVSLNIFNFFLHRCVFDTRARNNVMPLRVMRRLGLECTCPCKYLLSLDSKIVETIGYIKDLSITFNQAPNVSMLIDVIVADIPEACGMLLGREWPSKFKHSFYFMEGTYFTFPHKGV